MIDPPLRLVFMGTPAFSVPTLRALLDSRHQVIAVYTQPPRPQGRGYQVHKSAVHQQAELCDLPVFTPSSLKNTEVRRQFAAHEADLAIVVAYGLILPQDILDIPALGCLNVHASLLPRWRGAAPLQRAIEAGDEQTGVTIMKMDTGLDTGPILLTKACPLASQTTVSDLHDTLSCMGGSLLLEALEGYASRRLIPVPQPLSGITYAHKLSREEGQINWRLSALELVRKIQALTPWPGVWFEHKGTRLKVLAAEALPDLSENAGKIKPGTVLDNELAIACGEGTLRIQRLQRPGGTVLETGFFLRGYPLSAGDVLSCPVTS